VFGHLLATELDVPEALRQMEARVWKRWTSDTLSGKSLLVVGYGAIGRRIGAVARAFGMRVEAIRRHAGASDAAEGVYGAEHLDDALGRADVVVNLLPLTPETESFWTGARFRRMREGATFVNVSRGATVAENDLLSGLVERKPARAILDVFREEPLPPSNPLRDAPGVWITPHVAGIGTIRPLAEDFAENWRRFRAGEPLLHLVDRVRGY
jgi:phosphoglycerate dehydrogenase-like enzyme